MYSSEKVDAVYGLRRAVEEKTRMEIELDANPTNGAKGRLLEAMLNVESCTLRAIEVCHACGRPHLDDAASVCSGANVVRVDFERRSKNPGGA